MPARLVGIFALGFLLVCPLILRATGAEAVSDQLVVHVLNRLAFGPTVQDFRRVKAGGIDRYIAEQLDPDSLPEPLELRWRLAALDTLRFNAVQLRQLYGPPRPLLLRFEQLRRRLEAANGGQRPVKLAKLDRVEPQRVQRRQPPP